MSEWNWVKKEENYELIGVGAPVAIATVRRLNLDLNIKIWSGAINGAAPSICSDDIYRAMMHMEMLLLPNKKARGRDELSACFPFGEAKTKDARCEHGIDCTSIYINGYKSVSIFDSCGVYSAVWSVNGLKFAEGDYDKVIKNVNLAVFGIENAVVKESEIRRE